MTRWIVAGLILVSASALGQHRDRNRGGEVGTTSVEVGGTNVEVGGTTLEGDTVDVLGGADFSSELTFNARRPAALWLNQSGNVVNCARIVGIGGGTEAGNFMLGIPAGRQKDCDIWLAVNEAQENGHVGLSYAFMCEIKHIRNVWGPEECGSLTRAANGELEALVLGGIYDQAAQYMAEVTDEEFEAVQEQAEMVQYRVEEQASLIATLEEQQALKDAEIARLRAEAARLAAAHEAEEADKVDRQSSLFSILERLNARIEEEEEAKSNE